MTQDDETGEYRGVPTKRDGSMHELEHVASRIRPEQLRSEIVEAGKEHFAVGLIDSLRGHGRCAICGCAGHHSWAYRLFAKIAKLVESEPQIAIAVFQQFGVSEPEARQLIQAGLRWKDADPESVYGMALEHVQDYRRLRGMAPLEAAPGPIGAQGTQELP